MPDPAMPALSTRCAEDLPAPMPVEQPPPQPSDRSPRMPPPADRRKVFVSYAREDADWARQTSATLRAAGHDVFLDSERLKPGDRWPRALRRALLDADMVLLGWSVATARSAWVRAEYTEALSIRDRWNDPGFLIVHRLDDSELPPALADIQALPPSMVRPRPLSPWMRFAAAACLLPLVYLIVAAAAAGHDFTRATISACVALAILGLGVPGLLALAARRQHRIAERFRRMGTWLIDPTMADVVRLGQRVVHRIYGPRAFSRRSILRATLVAAVCIGAVLATSWAIFGSEAGLDVFTRELAGGVPFVGWIFGVNVLSDVLALAVTLGMLRIAWLHPRWWVVLGLLVLDAAVACLLTLLPTAVGPMLTDYLRTGQLTSAHVRVYLSDPGIAVNLPSAFSRQDYVVPNAAAEAALDSGWWSASIGLLYPNSMIGLLGAACLLTACLPTLVLGFTLLAALGGRALRGLTRVPARVMLALSAAFRPWVVNAYSVACPALWIAAVMLVAFDDPRPDDDRSFGTRSTLGLVEGCRHGHGLEAIDACIAAARRYRDRRELAAMYHVLSTSRTRLLERVRRGGADDCGPVDDCWVVGRQSARRLVHQYKVGDYELLAELLRPHRYRDAVRIGTVDTPPIQTMPGAAHLAAMARISDQERIELTFTADGEPAHRRVYILRDAEPDPFDGVEIRPGSGEVEVTEPGRVHLCRDDLGPLLPDRATTARFGGPVGTVWRLTPVHADRSAEGHPRIGRSGGWLAWRGTTTIDAPGDWLSHIPAGGALRLELSRSRSLARSRVSGGEACAAFDLSHAPGPGIPGERWAGHLWDPAASPPAGVVSSARAPAGLLVDMSSTHPLRPVDRSEPPTWASSTAVARNDDPEVDGDWRARWRSCGETRSFETTGAGKTHVTSVTRRLSDRRFAVAYSPPPAIPGADPRSVTYPSACLHPRPGWVALLGYADVARVSAQAPVMQTNGRFVGQVVERDAGGRPLSRSALVAAPEADPEGADAIPAVFVAPVAADGRALIPFAVDTGHGVFNRAGSPWASDRDGPLGDMLLRAGDRVVAINGVPVDLDRMQLASAGPALLRMHGDHITLAVERPDPIELPGERLPYAITVEYTPHPLDPDASRAWLDAVVGPAAGR